MKFIILLSLILTLASCSDENRWDCFKRAGNSSIKTIKTPYFDNIELNSRFKVKLIQDTTELIEISGGENLLPLIRCKNENGILSLSNENRCNWTRSYDNVIEVKVHYRSIKNISINDFCELGSDNEIIADRMSILVNRNVVAHINLKLKTRYFELKQISGTGTYNISGETDTLYSYIKGTGHLFAGGLNSTVCQVSNFSTGDMHVKALSKLIVEHTGKGNIFYGGNPAELIFDPGKSSGQVLKD